MKKRIIFCLMLFSLTSFGQTEFGDTFKSRLYFGGNFGLNLGTITMLEVSPLAGVNLTERLSAGVGFSYIYFSDNRYTPSLRFNMLGTRVFTRFLIFDQLFAHAEYEVMSYKDLVFDPINLTNELQRIYTPALPIGFGYRSQLGANSYFTIMLLYDTMSRTNENTLYPGGLLYRMGFVFGLY